jgi:hypothetical protein
MDGASWIACPVIDFLANRGFFLLIGGEQSRFVPVAGI